MESFHWICPYCNRDTTITNENFVSQIIHINQGNKNGDLAVEVQAFVCPNKQCREVQLNAILGAAKKYPANIGYGWLRDGKWKSWSLLPQSNARVFPEYIPQQLRNDYSEACAILKLSPKASATLARRCLQGMIRDFWDIRNKSRLKDEIDAIKDKVDPLTWQAIEAVREVGNIGAHMEKDVDLIIDVDPDEAEKLISLIEMLFQDWYITRYQREERLLSIKQIGADKTALKKAGKESDSV